jgi:excisionase family DNA binding protein
MRDAKLLDAAPKVGLATVQEAAEFLHVCRTSVYAMMRDNELPSVSIRNAKRIPWQALHKITDAAMQQEGGAA